MDISFKEKASIEDFQPLQAFMLSGFGKFQRKEDFISEKTLACLKPEEENLSPSAAKNIFDIGLGIALGAKDYGVDLPQGIGLILQARSNPMILANEMRPLAQSIALDPKGTWNNITRPITDSFKDNMINGDYTSQARYSTYMLLSVADIFFGTHGAGAAAKGSSTLSKVGKITKVPSPALKNSIAQTQKWESVLGDANFGGGNVLNKSKLQQDLLKPTQLMTHGKYFNKTDYSVPYTGESVDNLLSAAKLREESKLKSSGNTRIKQDGIEIIEGKVAGKVPLEDFISIREASVHNANAESITLGKYNAEGKSYITEARNSTSAYFDLGNDWGKIQENYNLTNDDMFELFNVPALDDAVASRK